MKWPLILEIDNNTNYFKKRNIIDYIGMYLEIDSVSTMETKTIYYFKEISNADYTTQTEHTDQASRGNAEARTRSEEFRSHIAIRSSYALLPPIRTPHIKLERVSIGDEDSTIAGLHRAYKARRHTQKRLQKVSTNKRRSRRSPQVQYAAMEGILTR